MAIIGMSSSGLVRLSPGAVTVAFCLLGAILQACTGGGTRSDGDSHPLSRPVWPPPPDPPRFVYETLLRSSADITATSPDDLLRRQLTGELQPTEPAFEKIAAVAARFGRIYVADSMRSRIVVFDVPRRKVFQFGLRRPGNVAKPVGLALDGTQNVYVVDAAQRCVLVYDGLGLYLRSIGTSQDLERPTGVAVDAAGKRIYVIDRATNESERHRVVVFDAEGRKLKEFGRRGADPGEFNVPVQGAVAPDGTLYVLDSGNFRVQAFDADGAFLRQFGGVGAVSGSFSRPRGIAVDGEGRVYVSDGQFGNFQIFDRSGQLLLAVGRSGSSDAPGRYGLISGLSVDETGRVYVADQLFNKIEVIRPAAETVSGRQAPAAQVR